MHAACFSHDHARAAQEELSQLPGISRAYAHVASIVEPMQRTETNEQIRVAVLRGERFSVGAVPAG